MSSDESPNTEVDALNSDLALSDQLMIDSVYREIEESTKVRPLMGQLESFQSLMEEFSATATFLPKIELLKKRFGFIRRVRGDGNCFYRSFMYSLFCIAARDPQVMEKLLKYLNNSLQILVDAGESEVAIEMFVDITTEELVFVESQIGTITNDEIAQRFNDESISPCLVTWAKLVTVYHLKQHSDEFSPYLENGQNMQFYIDHEVMPQNRECDNLTCIALATEIFNCTGLVLEIVYMDQVEGPLNSHAMPDTTSNKIAPQIFLLYRPGHYDVLYPLVNDEASSSS